MSNPLMVLLVAGGIVTLTLVLFWPGSVFWRWREMVRRSTRIYTEDALKHLYDAESMHRPVSVQSLAGALGIFDDRAAELLVRLEARSLVRRVGRDLSLTSEGRAYALRVIRIHRLWEHYLAEETGVSEPEWHREAELQEHAMSAGEANALAARMGHPRYDPHGDPIPTSSGQLPPHRGQPLNTLPIGDFGVITHLEDEPVAVYSQLVAEGLHPGMRVQVMEVVPERVRFWGDGDEHVLAPVFAANVSVVPIYKEVEEIEGPFETLASLMPGESGRILMLAGTCRGMERRRLMDMGFVPGAVVLVAMRSAAGDPTAYRVRDSLVALRREQAKAIRIERESERAQ